MRSRSVRDCLDADAGMARLATQAARLSKLQSLFTATVPAALARHGRVANLKPGKLVIHAENGAVAAKIRQLTSRLAEVFRQEGVDVNEIVVKVQPAPRDPAAAPAVEARSIGKGPKQALTSLSERLPEGSPLKAALRRLVGRAKI